MSEIPLQALQSWMQAVVQHPAGAAAGVASRAARRHLDVDPSALTDVVASTATLGAGEKLELYNRGYHSRLLECLRKAYPALLEVVGAELFEAFARDYLAARPPRSYTLLALTHGFADHLQATRPDEDAPEEWVDLVVDVARAEQAFVQVFEGPGSEDDVWQRPDDLPEEPESALLEGRLQLAPAFRLLSTRFELAELLLAARRGERTAYPPAEEGGLAVTRRDFVVILTPLDRAQHDVLQALADGGSIAGAAGAAGVDPVDAWRWVRVWSGRVFFRSLEVDSRPVRAERDRLQPAAGD